MTAFTLEIEAFHQYQSSLNQGSKAGASRPPSKISLQRQFQTNVQLITCEWLLHFQESTFAIYT